MKHLLYGLGILLVGVITLHKVGIFDAHPRPLITIYQGSRFKIPSGTKNLALLGCTPHPTAYVQKHGCATCLRELRLEYFLDIEYLKDSLKQVFHLCKENKVDHLLIAYLPIYFVALRTCLKETFLEGCTLFFKAIMPQINELIQTLAQECSFSIPITLLLPSQTELLRTPCGTISDEERIRYSIKQFPRLENFSYLDTITIINNKNSGQNTAFIGYLEYEYLYEKKIGYQVVETNKEKFHRYKE
jgi:hypothetical protein